MRQSIATGRCDRPIAGLRERRSVSRLCRAWQLFHRASESRARFVIGVAPQGRASSCNGFVRWINSEAVTKERDVRGHFASRRDGCAASLEGVVAALGVVASGFFYARRALADYLGPVAVGISGPSDIAAIFFPGPLSKRSVHSLPPGALGKLGTL